MAGPTAEERRATGPVRVPFVRRCGLERVGLPEVSAFLVNINLTGAYIAFAEMPPIGQTLQCRFRLPDAEHEVTVQGVVAWTNPLQQHPVHSLPPGFGVNFQDVAEEVRAGIGAAMAAYDARPR